jgi:hypothetical protein
LLNSWADVVGTEQKNNSAKKQTLATIRVNNEIATGFTGIFSTRQLHLNPILLPECKLSELHKGGLQTTGRSAGNVAGGFFIFLHLVVSLTGQA